MSGEPGLGRGIHARRWRAFACAVARTLVLLVFGLTVVATGQGPAWAQEAVLDYQTEIDVEPNGDLLVTEISKVRAESNQIRTTFDRELPLDFRAPDGQVVSTDIEILGASRNGTTAEVSAVPRGDVLHVAIGDPNVALRAGEYVFRLRYRCRGQILHDGKRALLYWRSEHGGWALPVAAANVVVRLPRPAAFSAIQAFIGDATAPQASYSASVTAPGQLRIVAEQPLAPGHQLMIAAAFPRSVLSARSGQGRPAILLRHLRKSLAGLAALMFACSAFLLIAGAVGLRRSGGTRKAAIFGAPQDIGPAACRLVADFRIDDRALTATILALAAKSYLTIEEDHPGHFMLQRTWKEGGPALSPSERAVAQAFYHDRPSRFTVEPANAEQVHAARASLAEALEREIARALVRDHPVLFALILLVGCAAPVATMWFNAGALWAVPFVLIAGAALLVAYRVTVCSWPELYLGLKPLKLARAVPLLLGNRTARLALVAAGASLGAIVFLADVLTAVVTLAVAITMLWLIHHLRSYKRFGRDLAEQIDGFRDSIADLSRASPHAAVERTAQTHDQYLGYAAALDEERRWSRQFDAIVGLQAESAFAGSYRPRWYGGQFGPFEPSQFSQKLVEGLTRALAEARASLRAPGLNGNGMTGSGLMGSGGDTGNARGTPRGAPPGSGLNRNAFPACLPALALLAGWTLHSGPADAARPLRPLTLYADWKAQPEHGGFYEALARGYYTREGLALRIVPGGPQSDNSRLLAAGAIELGMISNAFQALNLATRHADTQVVWATFQKDPQVLMAHPAPRVRTLADLRSRPVFVSDATIASYWPWLRARFGFADRQIRKYGGSLAPWLADARTVQQGYVTSEPFTALRAGVRPQVFLLADSGYPGYAGMVAAAGTLIRKEPDIVRAFVKASARGWQDYLMPRESLSPGDRLIQDANPAISDAQIAFAHLQMKSHGLVLSGDAARLGAGAMTDTRWAAFGDLARSLGLAPATLDLRRAYTLRFLR